jgi:hypothetical protein
MTISPKIDDENYIQKISIYKFEEYIYDVQTDTRIPINDFLKTYIDKNKLYMVSQIKNKFILQNEDDYKLFSLKNPEDCDRLLELFPSIQDKPNMIIVKDISTIHRKYLYDLLIEKGFNKKFLYTSYTTYPR